MQACNQASADDQCKKVLVVQGWIGYLRRYCGVSMNCKMRARNAAPAPIVPSCLLAASSMTIISSILKMAAVRAICPATAVANSVVWVLSITLPGMAIDTVYGLPRGAAVCTAA